MFTGVVIEKERPCLGNQCMNPEPVIADETYLFDEVL